jgi:hypothetical protein
LSAMNSSLSQIASEFNLPLTPTKTMKGLRQRFVALRVT